MASKILFYVCLIVSVYIPILADQSHTYIVHMDLSVMPESYSSPHEWYLTTLTSLSNDLQVNTTTTTTTSTSSSKILYGYTHAIHGFSATLSPSELESLKNSPGYVSSTRESTLKLHTTHSTEFLGLNQDFGAWPASEYGKDVIIGFVDTGVWPESKSYNDEEMSEIPSRWKGECQNGTDFPPSMCNKKLIGVRYFKNGWLASNTGSEISTNSGCDNNGHGTHTSSIAAGSFIEDVHFGYAWGTTRGVAPLARVAIYKVLWGVLGHESYESDVLAAIDQAILDGIDILSISIGQRVQQPFHKDVIAIGTYSAQEKGIFISASAGNKGLMSMPVDNGAPWILTVGACTIDRELSGILTFGNGELITGSSLYPGNSTFSRIFLVNDCTNMTELDIIRDKIAVCIEEKISVLEQYYYSVRHSSVSGAIFITNNPLILKILASSFPAVFMNTQNGKILLDYIKNKGHCPISSFF